VAGNFFKHLCTAVIFSITFVALTGGGNCSRAISEATPLASRETSSVSEVSQALVGQRITVRGKFSLWGKLAPYITLDSRQAVYLVPKGSFTWGKPYSDMDSELVLATGTLRFYKAPLAETTARPEARAPDHFYFNAETTQVRLIGH
jgi:hypothetical protein